MAHKPILYFECDIDKDIIAESNGTPPVDVVRAASIASDFLPRNPISPETVKFSFNSENGEIHSLATRVDNLWVAYSIRDEKIRIIAVKQANGEQS
jgi:hypothetical protein